MRCAYEEFILFLASKVNSTEMQHNVEYVAIPLYGKVAVYIMLHKQFHLLVIGQGIDDFLIDIELRHKVQQEYLKLFLRFYFSPNFPKKYLYFSKIWGRTDCQNIYYPVLIRCVEEQQYWK